MNADRGDVEHQGFHCYSVELIRRSNKLYIERRQEDTHPVKEMRTIYNWTFLFKRQKEALQIL